MRFKVNRAESIRPVFGFLGLVGESYLREIRESPSAKVHL